MKITGGQTGVSGNVLICLLLLAQIEILLIFVYCKIQEYDIYEYTGEENDDDGGSSFLFQCVNKDGLRCQVRLRVQSDGSKQLYVDFNDAMWVYGLEER